MAEGASGSVTGRAMPKPADEEKQVAAAESRAEVARGLPPRPIVAQPQVPAVPAQDVAPGVQGLQKQERVIAPADAKEPRSLGAAQAPSEAQAKEQAALKKESAAAQQDTGGARYALQTAPQSASELRAAPSEFIVTTPNSKVLWRFGSAGRIERSRDAGKTWETQVARGLPPRWQESFLSGSAPSESICWAGGSNGVLLRTTDGGENWERIPSPTKGDISAVKASDQFNVTVIGADGRTY
ncbi:MAG: hypothetical protein HY012_02905 [Acidobacteria bacterium]|nr:hypothetical protein [Acidobacteriota bacterium]